MRKEAETECQEKAEDEGVKDIQKDQKVKEGADRWMEEREERTNEWPNKAPITKVCPGILCLKVTSDHFHNRSMANHQERTRRCLTRR
jgi:hypothetical protein